MVKPFGLKALQCLGSPLHVLIPLVSKASDPQDYHFPEHFQMLQGSRPASAGCFQRSRGSHLSAPTLSARGLSHKPVHLAGQRLRRTQNSPLGELLLGRGTSNHLHDLLNPVSSMNSTKVKLPNESDCANLCNLRRSGLWHRASYRSKDAGEECFRAQGWSGKCSSVAIATPAQLRNEMHATVMHAQV